MTKTRIRAQAANGPRGGTFGAHLARSSPQPPYVACSRYVFQLGLVAIAGIFAGPPESPPIWVKFSLHDIWGLW